MEEKCILIAEENDEDYQLLCETLKSAGLPWKCIRINSMEGLHDIFEKGLGADDAVLCEFPEILFIDPHFKNKNALTVLARLKEIAPKKVTVVVHSRNAEVKVIREAYQAGADTIFHKPIVLKELVDFLTYRGILQEERNEQV